jgi:branched-chain amino acid transport system ATP-binding protein
LAPTSTCVLRVEDLTVSYGHVRALRGVSLEVYEGEVVTLIGANGAGKSTVMESIVGLVRPTAGRIQYLDHEITRMPTSRIVARGVALVPEGRGVVPGMTVLENLQLGAYHAGREATDSIAEMLERFPILGRRQSQMAGSLSGGEQQMLVIARALVGKPKLLLLDEPSLGLAPVIVSEVFRVVAGLGAEGYSVLLAEQNARKALQCASRAYVFETGKIAIAGTSDELKTSPLVQQAYLGGG